MFGQRTALFVQGQVAFLKLRDTYDLLDPESQVSLGQVKDEPANWAKWARLLVKKRMLPTTLNVYALSQPRPVLSVHKRPGFLRTRLEVRGADGQVLARVRSKVFSLGGAFAIEDPMGQLVGELKGDWKGWDYKAIIQNQEIGLVTKKWAGLLQEAFTNADKYLVQSGRPENLPLLLGLALAVDVVYKENQG
jgi:uncharacterized protein YxjI